MVKTSEYNYIIKTIILSLLIRKPRLFSIHFCTKKLLEYFLTIDTYYDSEERDKKFLISSRMGHAFGRISVDLYREAADTLWSRSINGARCFDPVITVSQERALFRRQRTRIESRRYLHPCTRGRRFNASFEFLEGIDNVARSSFRRNVSPCLQTRFTLLAIARLSIGTRVFRPRSFSAQRYFGRVGEGDSSAILLFLKKDPWMWKSRTLDSKESRAEERFYNRRLQRIETFLPVGRL